MAICPFLTNHVMSGVDTAFVSQCTGDYNLSLFTRACYFSEGLYAVLDPEDPGYQPNEWDGGLVFMNCIETNCHLWDSDNDDCSLKTIPQEISNKLKDDEEDGGILASVVSLLNDMKTTVESLQTTVESLQTTVERIETTIEGIETTIEGIETTIEGIETTIEGIETKFDDLNSTAADGVTSIDNTRTDMISGMGEVIEAIDQYMDYFECVLGKCGVDTLSLSSGTDDLSGISLLKVVRHFHDSHTHQFKHIVEELPSKPGWPAGMAESAKNANEWLLQDDIDGDGVIYGPEVEEAPILKSLRNHCDWTGGEWVPETNGEDSEDDPETPEEEPETPEEEPETPEEEPDEDPGLDPDGGICG